MSEKLIKPYEISVWEEKLIQKGDNCELVENKLAIIGSNTMTGLNKVYDPVFNKKTNGEKTLSFSLKYKYFDPYSENEEVINPFASLLVNERKIKLHYDDEWYEFIIKDHSESSEDFTWSYTCTDAFVYELSKTGYNIEFDAELSNNQGTAQELAEKTLQDTDWKVKGADPLKQLIEEPIYNATLASVEGIQIINANTGNQVTLTPGIGIYLFYSYVANKEGKFVQFILKSSGQYTIDEKNVITDTNYRILTELVYKDSGFYIDQDSSTPVITWNSIDTYYQANRLAYNQKTTYDPVTKHTVDCFKSGSDREIYKYSDSVYTTSNVAINFIANSDNFNVLEDGTLRGWNPYVDSSNNDNIKKLELVSYPELGAGKELANIDRLSQIEGYLKVQFVDAITENYLNPIFNDGFQNNASFIDSVSAGDEFVFRWRAGSGELDSLAPNGKLGIIVAKCTRDTPGWGRYYYHIDPNNIILDIRPDGENEPEELNNIIEGGEIQSIEGYERYVIDGVIQTISTNYLYVNGVNGLLYYWDKKNNRFRRKDESFLPYYYLVGRAKKSISNSVLTDPNESFGIFIYTIDNSLGPVYIQDIQLTRCMRDARGKPVVTGNVPRAQATAVDYYYLKPTENMSSEDVRKYASLDDLKEALGLTEEIVPVYNDNSEKVLSISASKSNCFDILQNIAETFECWVDLVVDHDDMGYITYTDGAPNKFVYLREYVGKDNYAGFKYGININSIERTINSDEIVTKLIVDQSQSEYVDEGYVSIANAPSNQSGESYILNFEYYYNQGLLDREICEKDKTKFIEAVKKINLELQQKEKEKIDLESALIKLNSSRTTYTELLDSAVDQQQEALADFHFLTGKEYEEYKEIYNREVDPGEEQSGEVDPEIEKMKTFLEEENVIKTLGKLYTSSATLNNYSGILTNVNNEYWDTWKKLHGEENYSIKIWTGKDDLDQTHVYIELDDYLVGLQIFTGDDGANKRESTINKKYFDIVISSNYSTAGTLIVGQSAVAYGEEAGIITLKTPGDFYFKLSNSYIGSTYKYRVGDIITLKIITDESIIGIEDEVNDLLEEKRLIINAFQNKYNRFISEGTWNSTDYIDPELYYLDALQVSNTSAQPAVSYTINVVEVSQLEGLELYSFDAGDKTYIEDTEFFGWANVNVGTEEEPKFVLTPAREEVIVSEVEWHLDSPEENVITVQNYKTRFEDLFQRISATVQTVQYNEATYAKMSTLLDANGTINENVLLDSLQRIAGKKYNLTSDGSVLIDGDCILVQNLTETNKRVIITSEGIKVSSDGGRNWATAIDGHGINIGTVYTGKLNTDQVIIGNDANPSFRWDKSGISAYKSDAEVFVKTEDIAVDSEKTYYIYDSTTRQYSEVEEPTSEDIETYYEKQTGYDLKTFVRYDQYGLYGIKDNGTFLAQSLEDVKDKAHFAVTWDGFFIKNSYEGGGRVEITSDNDFRVLNDPLRQGNFQEKIKIGALEWGEGITSPNAAGATALPTLYGIRIKNNAGDTVMKTGDNGNLEITGTIYADAGEIGGVSIDSNRLKMNHIILQPGVGIYSDYGVQSGQTNYPFIISDTSGKATFRDIEALGGILSNLLVKDTITVGDSSNSGLIKSQNYTTGVSGWAIKSNGTAEFQNAIVRGEVNAGSGNFYGTVTVGKENAQDPDYIIIDGQNALIRSANYQDGAGTGWLINNEGDAYFNNITARGAIKTAVFEYAEIQAVGGIFIFRPSSTIKSARISGNDLILKVEKPLLFAKISYNEISDPDPSANPQNNGWYERTNYGYRLTEDTTIEDKQYYNRSDINNGSWCKISNYLSNGAPADSTIQNILLTNGLTHVYQISNVNTSTNEVTLENAAMFVSAVKQTGETDDDVLKQLEGGALVDMGRKDGSSNYGIGVNSSDNTVNLPARAISLFETEIDETKDVKVTYNYRGILGTLPTLPTTDVSNTIYNQQMAGTQGIYTDNMYIGDKNQYIAFYEDEHGDKQLRIKANQIVYEVVDEDTGRVDWHDVANIETEGVPGPPGPAGEDAITVHIDSSAGEVFLNKQITTTLTCTVVKGNGTDITNQVTRFNWIKKNADGTVDTSWSRPLAGNTISISEADVTSKAIFICEVEF